MQEWLKTVGTWIISLLGIFLPKDKSDKDIEKIQQTQIVNMADNILIKNAHNTVNINPALKYEEYEENNSWLMFIAGVICIGLAGFYMFVQEYLCLLLLILCYIPMIIFFVWGCKNKAFSTFQLLAYILFYILVLLSIIHINTPFFTMLKAPAYIQNKILENLTYYLFHLLKIAGICLFCLICAFVYRIQKQFTKPLLLIYAFMTLSILCCSDIVFYLVLKLLH